MSPLGGKQAEQTDQEKKGKMEVQRIGKRGYLFIFEFGDAGTDTTNVYVIKGAQHWFVIDTFLGPAAIAEIAAFLETDLDQSTTLVINTHAHYDHFWGNCAFRKATIIGHVLCKQDIRRPQQIKNLEKNVDLQQGQVELVAPNLTFEKRLIFEAEGVELFHSPGHTRDSLSIIDHEDQVLLVGDNLGLPIPSIYPGVSVAEYMATLETYRALGLPQIISSHYSLVKADLVAANLQYLYQLAQGDTAAYEQGAYKFFHDWNQKMLTRSAPEN
jgi:glyoxylase-like metal-dependent hydrolase (beta-lactamase superfamily II)